ncbi:DUF547 domain-containing protein [Hwanghaeella grinnelliae]|uniref:DUF547 domain-containing protein n=1 Tax=Hwanghaeella grinnelliae TaxID=2500179 RepID=A0A3S2Y3V9_9PROT|nr:DUF547 domain-containing protein [Hwanghaeella grinnelliae]RVU37828.1 DUF547 domain-containing protein [Hwanghaeella grinnelliae]
MGAVVGSIWNTGRTRRQTIAALALALPLLLPGLNPAAAKSADLWDIWLAHDEAATARIEHGAWDQFLGKYVYPDQSGVNRVAYDKVTEQDRAILKAYIARLAGLRITAYPRAEQEAYWVNLYNALTLDVVLDHYPVKSIRDIDISGLFSNGPWGKDLVEIEDHGVSLDDIEHRILRPIWQDPRTHYVVNCASIGCPNLLPVAVTADTLDEIKTEAARAYVNHPRGVTITGKTATISKIYDWFSEDFGGSESGIRTHLMLYADPALAKAIAQVEDFDYAYDWSLNGK